tara:strand:- start:13808 stop:14467 length:660 start_codon:yes stop_codon:yes gene_type:complete
VNKSSIKLKICGITQPQQAREIASLGVYALGVIGVKSSLRFVPTDKTSKLFEEMTKVNPKIKRVLVVANINDDDLEKSLINKGSPTVIQLHGNENVDRCRNLRLKYPHLEFWKAFRIGSEEDINYIDQYKNVVDCFLFDSWTNNQLGGTGNKIKLELITNKRFTVPFWIAGGISAEWAPEIFKHIHPYGIDASSKLEEYPGFKDIQKVRDLIKVLESIS